MAEATRSRDCSPNYNGADTVDVFGEHNAASVVRELLRSRTGMPASGRRRPKVPSGDGRATPDSGRGHRG
jgi:hypothetical protein